MKKMHLFLLAFLLFISCKTKINQYIKVDEKHKKRHGIWKEEYSADGGTLTAIGRYREGEKVGKWKAYFGDQIYEKSKIRKNVTKIKRYYPDGTLMESGQSQLDISENERHWYYLGDWKYFREKADFCMLKLFTAIKIQTVFLM